MYSGENRFLNVLSTCSYAILHSWQGLPDYLPSDLDIAVSPEELPKLEKALLETTGARLVQLLQHESTCCYFVLGIPNGKKIEFLAIDAATDYRRNGRVWFSAEELLKNRKKWKDFWVAGPEVEFKYLLVKKILKGSLPPQAGRRLQELAQELGTTAKELNQQLLGAHWGAKVLDWLIKGDFQTFESHLQRLKRVLKRERFKQDFLNPMRYWLPEIRRIWHRWRYATGLWVAILGPNDAAKSALIRGLQKESLGAFRRTEIYHLMPGLLKSRRAVPPVAHHHTKPACCALVSLLKLTYYWLDCTLGYWLKIRPALVRSTLVLFDGYFHDLLLHPYRHGYRGPMWAVRCLSRLIPVPDVFLVLEVPMRTLPEWNSDVPQEELERQANTYGEFARSKKNAVLIDATDPSETLVSKASEVLLDVLHRRYLQRRGRTR